MFYWLIILLSTTFTLADTTSLIRKYDRDFYFSHPYQLFSKTIHFRTDKNEIFYIASRHKECKLSQKRIDHAIEKKPDLVVIEGLYAEWGINPIQWDLRIANGIPIEGCDVYYAYKKAKESKIDFLGTELGKLKNYTPYERDVQFIAEIQRLRKLYKKILVVYGAGHFVQQELALEKIFGKPISVK